MQRIAGIALSQPLLIYKPLLFKLSLFPYILPTQKLKSFKTNEINCIYVPSIKGAALI
ncbi:hypothetical protein C427_4982 [Paraglaciecola psychrophila 170]|uniref:Uncharacterized protein n=1 Tax=Paraglaciecola psychrophila 170 TaxID=1129794 RepID=K7AD34_9ALTE|nr:hypothetical protein C427_4982 [Paraglaciecola psychrophila 170]GAC40167.1 hypothetical protein GPSY_4564 [Paraglaciecola psychrophila 170]